QNSFTSDIVDIGGGGTFNNLGTYSKSGAATTSVGGIAFNNSGTVNVNAGTLDLNSLQGTGTLQIGAVGAAILNSTNSTVGILQHNGAGASSLNLGGFAITVSTDYNNANFGTGNAFNRRANVSTSGIGDRLIAAGNANQGVSGAGVVNGATTTPVLTIGNVHVGATTFAYNIDNTGSTGPALRGAIQTGVNGGNITDARLSGNGVTAGNWGALATGNSLARDVVLTVGTAGVYAPISGQAVSIVNNFDNTRSQVLTIASAAGAAAYNLAAAAAVTPNPVNLANQRVGGTASAALTVANTAPAGSFTEGLNASFGALSGSALSNGGAVNLLAGGASNNSAMAVRVEGSTAGAKTGTVQVNFASDGSGSSGLGITALPSQTISVNGNFYNAAVGSATPSPITIANQRVGGTGSQLLSVANTAAIGLFSEALNASFSAASGAATSNGGSLSNLIAGGTNAASMSVGVNTATAGAKAGTVTLAYLSDGTGSNGNSGLAAIAAGSQLINVSGSVFQIAQPAGLPASVNLGNFRAGTAQSQTVTLTNTDISPAGFQEGLNASIVGTTGAGTGSGALNNVAAGASGNLQIGVSGVAGANTGSVQVQLASNGSGTSGLGNLNLGGAQTVTVSGTGWRLASTNAQPATINFGNVLVGSTQAQFLNIQNTAIADGFSEGLDARFLAGGTTGAATNNGGSIGLLAAGASNNAAMSVGVSTATIGAKTGQVIVAYDSNGSGTSGLGITGLPSQNIGILANVEATVGTLAQPSAITPNPVNFGNFRVGAAGTGPVSLAIGNLATIGEGLNASIASGSAGFAATGSFISLAPGATNNSSLQVSFNGTGTAGAKSGTATVTLVSDGTFNGGTTTALPSQTVSMNAGVYNAAVGSTTPGLITIANQRVGGTGGQALTISNTAAAGAFSEALNASFGGSIGAVTFNGGSVSNLIAGGSNNAAMSVGVDATSAGAKSGSVTLAYQSDGTGSNGNSGLAAIAAGSQLINVSGSVFQIAQPTALPASLNLGNFRAGTAQSQTVTLTNTNISLAGFQEGLNASIVGSTGAGTGSGALNNVAAGASGNLQIGVTGAAGANTGSVQVQFASNGSGTSGLGNLNLGGAQTVTVSGTGWRLAQANAIGPINFGNVLAGSTQVRTVSISNLAAADGFSEALNAAFGSFGGSNAASFAGSGAINGLLAGNSDNATMVVTLNTSATGSKTANVQILLASNGTAIGNGLGITSLPTQVINLDGVITGTVGSLASAGLSPTTVNFGKFREGQVSSQTQQLTVSNLTSGPGEGLNASFGANTGGASNNAGSIAALATGASNNTAMSVTLNGLATAGAKSGTTALNFVSDGSFNAGVPTPLPSQSVAMSAEVYRLAQAGLPAVVNLAARRVGDAAAAGALTIANGAASDGFSEGLKATIGAAPTGFGVSGAAVTGLIAAGAAESRTVSLSTAAAGSFGGTVNVALVSNGAGSSGFGDLAIGSASVAVNGNVYTPAVAQLNTPTISFGIVHVGDVVAARNVSVTNAATPTALNDGLSASLGGASGPFLASGSVAAVTAGATEAVSLRVGLSTASAGIFSGSATASFASHNAEMADAALAPGTVTLTGQVNYFAELAVGKLAGAGALALALATNLFTLDFGTILLGSTDLSTELGIFNAAPGLADLLGGSFSFATGGSGSAFSFSGFNPFAGIAAGGHVGGLGIAFDSAALGSFSQSITIAGFGSNASGFLGALADTTLVLRGTVATATAVPEPATYAMIFTGLFALWATRRRGLRRAGQSGPLMTAARAA
ncbi:MAG: choice-of-anchor D domain-containing protein, partial [Burkholderiaceae bacterium]|nr:choice-of-anchor D domain-containing protein [Burkholderiaceae bacterium]